MEKRTNIILLGANGFIGRNLSQHFDSLNHQFNLFKFKRNSLPGNDHYTYNQESLNELASGIGNETKTVIINAAYDSSNVFNNKKLIDFIELACKTIKVSSVVHLSSISVYDGFDQLVLSPNFSDTKPVSLYGKIKLNLEKLLIHKLNGQNVNIWRLPNIIGEGSSWTNYFEKLANAQKLFLPKAGTNHSMFLKISDFCEIVSSYVNQDTYSSTTSNLVEATEIVLWKEMFMQYGFKGDINHSNTNRFANSWKKDLILKVLSSDFFIYLLVNSKYFNSLIYSRLIGGAKASSTVVNEYYSENTARLIQSVDFQ
ncbi:NAD-dependent epimerase/dehydratase family protein [Pedobacter miscanthi]|uniref:NAD-dependent epimerase/dehydratase domain-containing protein n=1 Tax=Pedobacter miscanthi TaxID=2259170 RepID=A0A366KPG8_9SPHI|nr:NAD(P)-dependent oxidoreductase [Pedobacter miscanthi]RBQ03566.1 hypothetical protein DRW42_21405 [Pedobacter miscanthi]